MSLATFDSGLKPFNPEVNTFTQITDDDYLTRRPTTMIGKVFDFFSRGEYVTASFLHDMVSEESYSLTQMVGRAFGEVIGPERRMTMHDVLTEISPNFVQERPKTAAALSFAASIALDPTTYLTLGGGAGVRVAGRSSSIVVNFAKGEKTQNFFKAVRRADPEGGIKAKANATQGLASIIKVDDLTASTAKLRKEAHGPNLTTAERKSAFAEYRTAEKELEAFKVETAAERAEVSRIMGDLGYSTRDLVEQGGIKFGSKSLISGEQFKRFSDGIGLTGLVESAKSLPSVQALTELKNVFSVKGKLKKAAENALPDDVGFQELLDLRSMLSARLIQNRAAAMQTAEKLFGTFSKERSEAISDVLHKAQDRSARKASETSVDVAKAEEDLVLREVLQQSDLSDEERRAVVEYRALMNEIGEAEVSHGYFKGMLANYTPRRYNFIAKDPRKYVAHRKRIKKAKADGKPVDFTPGFAREFADLEEARALGYDPNMDILQVSALRFLEHRNAETKRMFDGMLNAMFDNNVPSEVAKEFRRVMGYRTGDLGWLDTVAPITNITAKLQSAFKSAATVLRPAFGWKQFIGNNVQRFAATGRTSLNDIAAFATKDPSARFLATNMVIKGQFPEQLTDVFGFTYTNADLKEIFRKYPVTRGVTLEGIGGNPSAGRMAKQLREKVDADLALGNIRGGSLPETRGALALLKRSSQYTELPQKIEDITRTSMMMDLMGQGYSPAEAFNKMESALFDYSTGVTEIEDRIVSSLVPFYRFQKFASVLTANLVTQNPGRVGTLAKTQRELMRAYGKLDKVYEGDTEGGYDDLTPSERAALPGFLFEQPSTFSGMDPTTKDAVFRFFGGVNFLDFMNLVVLDEKGEFTREAAAATLVQGGISQITPFVKAPLEILFEKNFFSGFDRDPDGSGRSEIDAGTFFNSLVAAASAQLSGGTIAGGALGLGAAEAVQRQVERTGLSSTLKNLIGWEEAVDPRDGKQKTYINPAMLQIVAENFFPQVSQAFGIARQDLSIQEKVMKEVMGISTVKLDLQKRLSHKLEGEERRMAEASSRYRRLANRGRIAKSERAYQDLLEVMSEMQENANLLTAYSVRGDGL